MRISEFEVSLVYRVSFRTARTTQRNPVSKKQQQQKKYVELSIPLAPVCLVTAMLPTVTEGTEPLKLEASSN